MSHQNLTRTDQPQQPRLQDVDQFADRDAHQRLTTELKSQRRLVSNLHHKIKKQSQKLKIAKSALADLKARQAIRLAPKTIDHKASILSRTLRSVSVAVPSRVLLFALGKSAQTADEMRSVLSKTRTFKRTCSDVNNKHIKARNERFVANINSVNRVFPNQPTIAANQDILADVFGRNVTKFFSKDMVFFFLPLRPELEAYRITMAHFDGKFSKCAKPFLQSVQLRVVLQNDTHTTTVTLARALLNGSSKSHYEKFFRCVRNAKCKRLPHIMVDFEIAISAALQEVMPATKIRGCWYHYYNNLNAKAGQLSRFCHQEASSKLVKLLSVLCFLHNPHIFLCKMLDCVGDIDGEPRFRNVHVKLILYVYATYLVRFRRLFFIDLSRSPVRTNNSCEGSNSGLSTFSARRLTVRDFADFAEHTFKRDAVLEPTLIKPETDLDTVTLQLQKASKRNVDDLFDFLLKSSAFEQDGIRGMTMGLPIFARDKELRSGERLESCKRRLEVEQEQYKQFCREKRIAHKERVMAIVEEQRPFVFGGMEAETQTNGSAMIGHSKNKSAVTAEASTIVPGLRYNLLNAQANYPSRRIQDSRLDKDTETKPQRPDTDEEIEDEDEAACDTSEMKDKEDN